MPESGNGLVQFTPTDVAIGWMETKAKDSKTGYDQRYRWGEYGDYDCSSAVITAWESAGIAVKANGASYTGNMYVAFLNSGFEDVTASVRLSTGEGLIRGDVLLNKAHHTAMYCGDGREVEASINENGTVTDGEAGDQTGKEFLIRAYRNFPWDCVLRYTGAETAGNVTESGHDDLSQDELTAIASEPSACSGALVTVQIPSCSRGCTGAAVYALQALLRRAGYDPTWVDGDFGEKTAQQLKTYQKSAGLNADGICGRDTWNKIMTE